MFSPKRRAFETKKTSSSQSFVNEVFKTCFAIGIQKDKNEGLSSQADDLKKGSQEEMNFSLLIFC